ncbi:hypothetical protein PUNSTDRAFT_123117 [Punctularia strigosozonata HHB-11173 SS5]|uniref:Uncharacterized protein n=1 Tax=Punctularia strigosozonata (strain HHB-11173) TaxID=741275 RepID=R7S236_PUNST|nr:uncharacterized protein PUNSTDRAFT_123117 [Punctularia strigosozonata HHB-11173 SS5]EIN03842.1 hypothetical protein PUNSTDRAFT_123117 [Punctularia strigosozonata HHB-11173 SS5]
MHIAVRKRLCLIHRLIASDYDSPQVPDMLAHVVPSAQHAGYVLSRKLGCADATGSWIMLLKPPPSCLVAHRPPSPSQFTLPMPHFESSTYRSLTMPYGYPPELGTFCPGPS